MLILKVHAPVPHSSMLHASGRLGSFLRKSFKNSVFGKKILAKNLGKNFSKTFYQKAWSSPGMCATSLRQ